MAKKVHVPMESIGITHLLEFYFGLRVARKINNGDYSLHWFLSNAYKIGYKNSVYLAKDQLNLGFEEGVAANILKWRGEQAKSLFRRDDVPESLKEWLKSTGFDFSNLSEHVVEDDLGPMLEAWAKI